MRASTAILLVLVAALVATSGVLWRKLENERVRASAAAGSLETAEAPADRVAPALAGSPGPGGAEPRAGGQGDAPDASADYLSDEARYYQNEAYREAQRKSRTLELEEGHIDIAEALGISREKADRLIALLVDQELRYLSTPHPNPRNEEELQARRLENERNQIESDTEIAAVIGELNLSKWHEYQASLPVRHQIRELRLELADGTYPLRADQVEPLIGIIHGEQQRARDQLTEFTAGLTWSEGMEAKLEGYWSAREADLNRAAEDRIRTAAGRILSPDQLEALIVQLRRDREQQQARYARRAAWIEAQRLIEQGN